jgi:nitrogen fixation NifU-like protein
MQGLDDLYREVILDHYRSPHGSDAIDTPDVEVEGFNPLCGDELKMKLRMVDGRIEQIEIGPQGCSISVASASMLAQQLPGRTIAEAIALAESFKSVMRGGDWPDGLDPGDLEALEGVKNFPVRIKCALLAWMTLEQALVELDPELAGNFERDSDIEIRPAH